MRRIPTLALATSFSSVSVIGNALRLKNAKLEELFSRIRNRIRPNTELTLSRRRETASGRGGGRYKASRSHRIAAVSDNRLQDFTVGYASGEQSAK